MSKSKKIVITVLLIILTVIIYNLIYSSINSAILSQKTGLEINAPEIAILSEFGVEDINDPHITYSIEDDVIFAYYRRDDGRINYSILTKDKGVYTAHKDKILAEGYLSILEFGVGSLGMIFKADEKYIVYLATHNLTAYDTRNSDNNFYESLETVNLNQITAIDNTGDKLNSIGDNNFKLYYKVMEQLPANYSVFINYKVEDYEIMTVSD